MKFLLVLTPGLFLLCSCALKNASSSAPAPQVYPFDGVKLVAASISDQSEPGSMTQYEYSISSSSRLLLRLESMEDKVSEVVLDASNKIGVDITLNLAADLPTALTSFQLCPVVKNWMMLATWSSAYPMGSSGNWSRPGVDYNQADCMSGTQLTTTSLTFDVSPWFVNYVKGRNQNYGLLLVSSDPQAIVIAGDNDVDQSPRIHWIKY